MLFEVFRVEGQSVLRDRAVWAVLAGFAGLVLYAALSGGKFARAEQDRIEAVVAEEAQRFTTLRRDLVAVEQGATVSHLADPRDAHLVGRDLGRRAATLLPGPLAAVSVGQRDLLPNRLVVTTEARLADEDADDAGSLARRVTGAFDLAFILVFLLPLVVIALTFDLLAGERERGTLALVLSQPVSLTTFVLGKALLRGSLLLAVVLLTGLAAPLISGAGLSGEGLPLSIALYVVLLSAYTTFWFCLALCMNAFGLSSAGNALSLMSVWLFLAVVVPGLASVVVDTLQPTPSRVSLVNRARDAARQAEAKVSELEGDHGASAIGAQRSAQRAIEIQSELESRVRPVVAAFETQLAEQQRLVNRLRFLSPAIVVYEGLNDVAGTGVARHQHFSRAVERFHAEYKRFFFERIRQGEPLTLADYEAMPRFEYSEPPPIALVTRVGTGLIGVLLPAGLLLGIALAGFRRYLSRGLK